MKRKTVVYQLKLLGKFKDRKKAIAFMSKLSSKIKIYVTER